MHTQIKAMRNKNKVSCGCETCISYILHQPWLNIKKLRQL